MLTSVPYNLASGKILAVVNAVVRPPIKIADNTIPIKIHTTANIREIIVLGVMSPYLHEKVMK